MKQIIYEDALAKVTFADNPIALGHLKVFPQKTYTSIADMPAEEALHLFTVASKCATLLFEGLKAHGTNIIVKEGSNAGAEYDRVCVEAIARTEGDNLDFVWEPKQGNLEEIKQVGSDIAKAIVVGEPTKTSAPTKKVEKVEDPQKSDKPNYLLDELNRIP